MKASSVLIVAMLMISAMAGVSVVTEDTDGANDITGVAFWSTTPSTSGRTSSQQSWIVGNSYTMYFCSPNITGTGYYYNGSGLNVSVQTDSHTFVYSNKSYQVVKYTFTPTSATTSSIKGANNGNWLGDKYVADLSYKITAGYTITFNAVYGAVNPTTMTTNANGKLSSLPTATTTLSGYTFNGWWTSQSGGTKITTSTVFTTDTTVYAHWIVATSVTVTLNGNGGSPATQQTNTSYGGYVTNLSSYTATRNGYTFNDWWTSQSGGTRVTSSTKFTSNTTIYAHWTREDRTYTITFNADGGSMDIIGSTLQTDSTGTLASLPNVTKLGYNFDGWYTASTGGSLITDGYTFTSNATLYAHWTYVYTPYYITFVGNGGSPTTITYPTLPNGKASEIPTATKTDNTFMGWWTDSNGGTQINANTVFTMDTTVYAHWTPVQHIFTITFLGNEGTPATQTMETQADGTLASLPTATREGYVFDGWYRGDFLISTSWVFTGDTLVAAHWSTTPGYTITCYTLSIPSRYTVQTDSTGTLTSLPTPIRMGYEFAGWYTASNGQGTRITVPHQFTANTPIYAYWTEGVYTITFNGNGGSPATQTMETQADGTLASLPTATREGYVFAGWWTQVNGGEQFTEDDVVWTNTTLYAHWNDTTSGSVYWENGYQNGRLQMLFNFPSGASNTHIMDITLNAIPMGTDRATTSDFTATSYKLRIECNAGNVYQSVSAKLSQNNILVEGGNTSVGKFRSYIVDIDAINGKVSVGGVSSNTSSFDFTNVNEYTYTTVLDYSDHIKFNSISKITHYDNGVTTNKARYQVYRTDVFMDTYGAVLNNPTINIGQYYPEYEALRLNLYSFALYGQSVTINGITWTMDGSQIAIPYTEDEATKTFTYNINSSTSKTLTLTNVYITWQDDHVYLTFVNDGWTVDLGSCIDPEYKKISFGGIWFFTTALYEPYTATELSYTVEWGNTMDADGMILIYLGVIVVSVLFIRVSTNYTLTMIDWLVIAGAGIIGYIIM